MRQIQLLSESKNEENSKEDDTCNKRKWRRSKNKSRSKKIEETERTLKLDTYKHYLKEYGNKKPGTNDMHKLKTRANETQYWRQYNNNEID